MLDSPDCEREPHELRVDVELNPDDVELAVAEAVTLVQALVEFGRSPAYFRELGRLTAAVMDADSLEELGSRLSHRIDALAIVAWGLWLTRETDDLAEATGAIERTLGALWGDGGFVREDSRG